MFHRCIRDTGGTCITRKTDADLVANEHLKIVTASVYIDVPGNQLGDCEYVVVEFFYAVTCVVIANSVDLTFVRYTQLFARTREVGAFCLKIVEI